MKLDNFFRGELLTDQEGAVQELMRAILIRAQFVPGIRHALGWRGLRQSREDAIEGWTARIEGFEGVFGLSFAGGKTVPGWVSGTFTLSYFPDPDEPLVERCSLRAAACTQQPDYMSWVREFLKHEGITSLFAIGKIHLASDLMKRALYMGLESLSAQRTIARDGVCLPCSDSIEQIIEPGGRDQDFPALSVAKSFLDILAASLAFHTDEEPSWLCEWRFPGKAISYDLKGASWEVPTVDIEEVIIGLGYGNGRFEDIFAALTDKKRPVGTEIQWQKPAPVPSGYDRMRFWNTRQVRDYKTLNKKSLGIDERPPFMILTGFLGAGKTSFLQHFIEYQTQRSRFVAVIQNEIGEVGLDGKLLDYTVTEIDEGCVCCSLVGNLKRAVQGILTSFQPDCIILETTGAANPLNLLEEIGDLEALVRYDCTVTVVDALNCDHALSQFTVAADQIKAADVLLLNKCDLVSETGLERVHVRIRDINPKAFIFKTKRGAVNPALIFDLDGRWENRNPVAKTTDFQKSIHTSHLHDKIHCQTMAIGHPLDRSKFLSAIESLPPTVFRMKGIIEFSDSPQPMLFQYVAGRYELSEFPRPEIIDRFLTVITQGKAGNILGGAWITERE